MKIVDGSLGAIARPARVHFISGLPKTRSGKMLRRSIQALAEFFQRTAKTCPTAARSRKLSPWLSACSLRPLRGCSMPQRACRCHTNGESQARGSSVSPRPTGWRASRSAALVFGWCSRQPRGLTPRCKIYTADPRREGPDAAGPPGHHALARAGGRQHVGLHRAAAGLRAPDNGQLEYWCEIRLGRK